MQVIVAPYCYLFCVLSNGMFNDYIDTLLDYTCTNIKVTQKNLHHNFETILTHACMDNKTPTLVCGLPKSLAMINKNRFTQHWGVKTLLKQVCSNYGALYIYNNLAHQHTVNLFMEITAKEFGNQYANFGGNLPMHAWVLAVSNVGANIS